MLEKFLVLLERFVVAHELIAANSAKQTVVEKVGEVIRAEERGIAEAPEVPVEGEAVIDTESRIMKSLLEMASQGVEPSLDILEALTDKQQYEINRELYKFRNKKEIGEEKPKRRKAAKPEPEPEDDLADEPEDKGPDLSVLRDEIKMMAKHVAAGESDKCADLFDELLEEFKVRTVPKLADDQVEDFHKQAKALVAKYYQIED